MSKSKKSKLKSTTALFKPVVAAEPEPSQPAVHDDDEPELEPAPVVARGPADIVKPGLGARAPPPSKWMNLNDTAKYISVSAMTLHRYVNDKNYAHLNFPEPSVLVDRCYWHVDDIDAWMRSRVGVVSTRKIKTKKVDAA